MSSEIKLPIFKVPICVYHFLPTLEGSSLQGTQDSYFLVEAKNKIEARLSLTKSMNFWKNYNQFVRQLSEQEVNKLSPFRLKREGRIERILDCEKRHKNLEGEYICGEPVSDSSNGEFGMCCIIGYDSVEGCPYYRKD